MRRWWIALGLLACNGKDGDTDATAALGDPSGCDPLVPEICALPFPSSLYEVDDASTPSGRRLAYGPASLPMNRDFVQLRPDLLNDKDGFSTLGPILVWFDGVSLEGTIGHEDLGAYLAADARTVLLRDDGERVPHFVELDAAADHPEQRVLMIRPVVPLEHDRRYVVAYRNLVREDGGAVPPSAAFKALRDGETTTDVDVESRRDRFEAEVFPLLEQAGFARSELQLAFDFHTVSRDGSIGPMLWMRDDTLERVGTDGPPYTIDSVEDADCQVEGTHVARTIYAHFDSPLYTEADAPKTRLTRGADGMPFYNGTARVDFMVRIPCSVANDPQGGARVLQYGHGLLGDFSEARTGYLSELIDTHRYVLIAQDWTGMATEDAGYITLMLTLDPSDFPMIPERTLQGFTEWVAGLRLATGALADDPNLQFGGTSVIDRTKKPVYYGNSQGAILGGAYFALSPDLERAVLGVGGMPYSLLLSRSADFDPFFLVFKEKFEDDRDIALILAAMQTSWDPGESGGYATALVDPLPGTPPKRVLLQVAVGDAQVTTLGAQIAARAYGAGSLAPAVRPIWGVDEVAAPYEGSAIVEWSYTDGSEEPILNLPPSHEGDTHECPRREPAAQQQLVDFLESGVVQQYCDGPCVGTRAGFCD